MRQYGQHLLLYDIHNRHCFPKVINDGTITRQMHVWLCIKSCMKLKSNLRFEQYTCWFQSLGWACWNAFPSTAKTSDQFN